MLEPDAPAEHKLHVPINSNTELSRGKLAIVRRKDQPAPDIKGDPESALFAWFFNAGKRESKM